MRVLIRADGDGHIGSGHVMRMLALADHLFAEGDEVHLACARLGEGLAAKAEALRITVHHGDLEPGSPEDGAWTAAEAEGFDWVVLDGYEFGGDMQARLRQAGLRCLAVDDYGHCARHEADLVLNQNVGATAELYASRAPDTQLLVGPDYVLLRPEFRHHHRPPPAARANEILVTLGGADPVDATATVIAALERWEGDWRAQVVIGPANPRTYACSDPRIELLHGTNRMAGLMAECDLAIAAAGTTANELCFMKVPSMLVVLAENQEAVAKGVAAAGAAIDLGWHHELDPDTLADQVDELSRDIATRARLSAAGSSLIDGRGASRVREAMVQRGRDQ